MVGITVRIASSAVTMKISVITAEIKKYNSIIKKKKKKHDKIELLISKALIDPNISNDEFVLVNNVLKEYDDMKEEFKNSNDK